MIVADMQDEFAPLFHNCYRLADQPIVVPFDGTPPL